MTIVLAWLAVFAMNAMPAFMPPTWAVLAFMHFAWDVPVVPLAIGGAIAAASGRLVLAHASRLATRLMSTERTARLRTIGRWIDARARWAAPLAMLVYSFGPIPSNQLFIAAGLTRMSLRGITAAFLAGRLISYPLWIGAAHVAVQRFDELFADRLANIPALVLDIALLASLVLFARIDWIRVIGRFDPSFEGHAGRELQSLRSS